MKNITSIAALLIFMITIFCIGCSGSYKHISQEEAAQMMKADSNIIVLDVRTQEEYDKKHIPGALLLPIEDIRKGNLEKLPDKNQKILVYCWTGRRAEDSAQMLSDNGYKNVYEIGGLVDWKGEVEGNEVNN